MSADGGRAISPDEDLIKRGIVDSLGVTQLVDFCESRYGIRVTDEDLVPANFQTLRRLADYVDRKQAEAVPSGRARIPVARPMSALRLTARDLSRHWREFGRRPRSRTRGPSPAPSSTRRATRSSCSKDLPRAEPAATGTMRLEEAQPHHLPMLAEFNHRQCNATRTHRFTTAWRREAGAAGLPRRHADRLHLVARRLVRRQRLLTSAASASPWPRARSTATTSSSHRSTAGTARRRRSSPPWRASWRRWATGACTASWTRRTCRPAGCGRPAATRS